MNAFRLKSALVWTTPLGRDLIRLDEGGKDATVAIGVASQADLRALAAAALEAADQMQAYATDAAIDASESVKPSATFVAFNRDDKLSEALQSVGL
jgi:hypothetical protein